ncbi:MAG TPA: response regulator [Nitrososphaera sp.]|jgi:CheY-like chemotaxis protein|nr:response regulator [Nitrososphaera sp.]
MSAIEWHQVDTSESAIDAIDYIRQNYDLIVSDIRMQQMTGFEFVRQIRKSCSIQRYYS